MENKRILVTGAQGFLGVRLVQYLKSRFDVVACGHEDLDITSLKDISILLSKHRPDYVLHCAAISDTGYAQKNPDVSFAVNVKGTVHLATICKEIGAKFIFMSSDQVYNGTKLLGSLNEKVELSPNSVYGKHKLEAEMQTLELLPTAVALRLTWMYDFLDSPYKLNRNVLANLDTAYQAHHNLNISNREFRGITWVWQVVENIASCLNLPGGAYNFGCENSLNSYQTFLAMAEQMGYASPAGWIEKDESRFLEHPRNLSMSLNKLRAFGIDFPQTIEGLQEALDKKSSEHYL